MGVVSAKVGVVIEKVGIVSPIFSARSGLTLSTKVGTYASAVFVYGTRFRMSKD